MNNGFVKVAAATPKIKVGDCGYNGAQICKIIDEVYDNGAQLVAFPELCITGYTCSDLFWQKSMLDMAKTHLQFIAEHCEDKEIVAIVGLPMIYRSKLYNVAAVIYDGEILGLVPKTYIPNYSEFYEARHFTSGKNKDGYVMIGEEEVPFGTEILFNCVNFENFSFAIEICEDLWVPNPPSTSHALAGATVIANLSASDETTGKDIYRTGLVSGQSARTLSAYIYADAGEGESTTDLVFAGHNIIAENGNILSQSKRFENQTIYADIDLDRLAAERAKMTTFIPDEELSYEEVEVELEPIDFEVERVIDNAPFVPSNTNEREKRCEEILSIQSLGLKKRLDHTHAKTAVVGVSGGLDSTLALLVTVRAFDSLNLDRKNIIAVTMPCFGTTDRTYNNAVNFANSLGVTLKEVNIKAAVNQHFADIEHDPNVYDVTYENSQARERTQILMDVANKSGGLVIGTGDMSELALGWATYNGDHMSMYGVNAGVPKTLIRYLVDYEAKRTNNDILKKTLQDILDTPVSPELLPPKDGKISQKTEHIVGPYELHDFFLYHLMRFGSKPSKILRLAEVAFEGIYDREVILEWLKVFYRRFFAQQFKRSCLPDGPKVGSVALSPRGDWRMPSDASYQIWAKELETL